MTQQASDDEATKVAQFPSGCEGVDSHATEISPDGNWLAISCGYTRNQTLVVQNKEGIKWVLDYKKFLSPDILQYGTPMGGLYPKFWSLDGGYLYFILQIGYDGGGDDCFPGYGIMDSFALISKLVHGQLLSHPQIPFPVMKSSSHQLDEDMPPILKES